MVHLFYMWNLENKLIKSVKSFSILLSDLG